jgi:hypothetical protein
MHRFLSNFFFSTFSMGFFDIFKGNKPEELSLVFDKESVRTLSGLVAASPSDELDAILNNFEWAKKGKLLVAAQKFGGVQLDYARLDDKPFDTARNARVLNARPDMSFYDPVAINVYNNNIPQ